jgi:Ca2+-binding EF-hand superfamily protein
MLDFDGCGHIDYNGTIITNKIEYVMASMKMEKIMSKEKILGVFRECDTDGNGFLSSSEIKRMLIKIDITPDKVQEVIAEFDKDKDGQVAR